MSEKENLNEDKKKIYEKAKELKEFIKNNKQDSKTNEQFFEENKQYFEKYDIKNYSDLEKLINDYNKENMEEDNENNKKKMTIEHIKNNDLIIERKKKHFDNLVVTFILPENENYIHLERKKNSFKTLKICKQDNEINNIPDIKQYINNKTKIYEEKNVNSEEINGIKKLKYNNESELIESSNITNINIDKKPKNLICQGGDITENGISSEELKNRKIKKMLDNFTEQDQNNYEKVKEIINDIKNKEKNIFIFDNNFCLNCNNNFPANENISHDGHSILQIEKNYNDIVDNDNKDLDYNANLNKLYEDLKKDQKKLLKSSNLKLNKYFGNLLFSLYEITINNNNIEELNSSIIGITDNFKKEIESKELNQYLYEYFLYYTQIIIKLTYLKVKKIEEIIVELEDDENDDLENNTSEAEEEEDNNKNCDDLEDIMKEQNNINDNLNLSIDKKEKKNVNFDEFSEKDKSQYFLKLGIDMKYKYGKKESISDLYNKAKEQNIEPCNYENFLMKELNISNNIN